MIKTTIGQLSSPGLQMALQKLAGAQVGGKTAYRFKKLKDSLDKEMNAVRDAYTKEVVKVYGKFDDKEKLVAAQTPWGFELLEGTDQTAFDKANENFHKREVFIDRMPISILDLNDVKISAAELSALDSFFADPETPVEETDNVAQPHR